jgi:hypothetical protein
LRLSAALLLSAKPYTTACAPSLEVEPDATAACPVMTRTFPPESRGIVNAMNLAETKMKLVAGQLKQTQEATAIALAMVANLPSPQPILNIGTKRLEVRNFSPRDLQRWLLYMPCTACIAA